MISTLNPEKINFFAINNKILFTIMILLNNLSFLLADDVVSWDYRNRKSTLF